MSTIMMLVVGLIGAVFTILYWISALRYKKRGKDKKEISEELVEMLKE